MERRSNDEANLACLAESGAETWLNSAQPEPFWAYEYMPNCRDGWKLGACMLH